MSQQQAAALRSTKKNFDCQCQWLISHACPARIYICIQYNIAHTHVSNSPLARVFFFVQSFFFVLFRRPPCLLAGLRPKRITISTQQTEREQSPETWDHPTNRRAIRKGVNHVRVRFTRRTRARTEYLSCNNIVLQVVGRFFIPVSLYLLKKSYFEVTNKQ